MSGVDLLALAERADPVWLRALAPHMSEAKALLRKQLRQHADPGVRAINEIAEPADDHPSVLAIANALHVRAKQICECGDYRRDHPNDGPCTFNGGAFDTCHGGQDCPGFRPALPAGEIAQATLPARDRKGSGK